MKRRRPPWFWPSVIVGGLVLLVAFAAAGAIIYQQRIITEFTGLEPPGEMVSIGSHRLHLHCTGEGEHTVLFEAGSGSWSLDWAQVQPGVAEFTRACSYDRAGHGFSDTGPEPRHIDQLVRELAALIAAARLSTPLILVGASKGGSLVQLYEQLAPNNVAAMVLVDARPKGYAKAWNEIRGLAHGQADALDEEARLINNLYEMGLLAALMGTMVVPEQIPPEHRPLYLHHGRHTRQVAFWAKEVLTDRETDQQMQAIGSVGDKPLVVITHGLRNMFIDRDGATAGQAEAAEDMWIDLQRGLGELSSNSRFVVAERAGHIIQFDQPELIVEEVQRLIETLKVQSM